MSEQVPITSGVSDPGDGAATPRLAPKALSVTYAAQVLTRVGGQRVTEEMLRADIDNGAPTNTDRTINLVQYAAFSQRLL